MYGYFSSRRRRISSTALTCSWNCVQPIQYVPLSLHRCACNFLYKFVLTRKFVVYVRKYDLFTQEKEFLNASNTFVTKYNDLRQKSQARMSQNQEQTQVAQIFLTWRAETRRNKKIWNRCRKIFRNESPTLRQVMLAWRSIIREEKAERIKEMQLGVRSGAECTFICLICVSCLIYLFPSRDFNVFEMLRQSRSWSEN